MEHVRDSELKNAEVASSQEEQRETKEAFDIHKDVCNEDPDSCDICTSKELAVTLDEMEALFEHMQEHSDKAFEEFEAKKKTDTVFGEMKINYEKVKTAAEKLEAMTKRASEQVDKILNKTEVCNGDIDKLELGAE